MSDTSVDKAVDAIADRLIGQCIVSLEQAVEEICDELAIPVDERRKQSFLEAIDDKVFCCDGCGWYCDTEELRNETGELLCDDCAEQNQDEDLDEEC